MYIINIYLLQIYDEDLTEGLVLQGHIGYERYICTVLDVFRHTRVSIDH